MIQYILWNATLIESIIFSFLEQQQNLNRVNDRKYQKKNQKNGNKKSKNKICIFFRLSTSLSDVLTALK